MHRFVMFLFLGVCLAPIPALGGGSHNYQTGKLIDLATDERLVEGNTVRHAVFIVQLGDVVYTLRGERVSQRGTDYGQGLIVGDSVRASVEGDYVFLLKPDGKVLKTAVLKRERAQAK